MRGRIAAQQPCFLCTVRGMVPFTEFPLSCLHYGVLCSYVLSDHTMHIQSYDDFSQGLSKVVDLDKLLGQLTQRPRTSTPRTARQAVQTVIDLKQLLEVVSIKTLVSVSLSPPSHHDPSRYIVHY
jgi:hypothetical protein